MSRERGLARGGRDGEDEPRPIPACPCSRTRSEPGTARGGHDGEDAPRPIPACPCGRTRCEPGTARGPVLALLTGLWWQCQAPGLIRRLGKGIGQWGGAERVDAPCRHAWDPPEKKLNDRLHLAGFVAH